MENMTSQDELLTYFQQLMLQAEETTHYSRMKLQNEETRALTVMREITKRLWCFSHQLFYAFVLSHVYKQGCLINWAGQ